MERRTFLLGSGVVFASALAGCTETSSDEDDSGGDDDGTDDGDTDDETHDEKREAGHVDDIDGFDEKKLEKYGLDVEYVIHDEKKLDVGVKPSKAMSDDDYEYATKLGDAMADAVGDYKAFEKHVESISMTVYGPEKAILMSVYVNVALLRAYTDDELTDHEFVEKVLAETH
ncbi:hypothetical protein OB905_13940 [Halobacteria archaeon AArc-dxtr1]|nr:hypothetical protein [Halobacteria archaeon AArc-dxtr1]